MTLVTLREDFEDGTLGQTPVLPDGVGAEPGVVCFAEPARGSLSAGCAHGSSAEATMIAWFDWEKEVPAEEPPGKPWATAQDAWDDYYSTEGSFSTYEQFSTFLTTYFGSEEAGLAWLNTPAAPTVETGVWPIRRVAQRTAVRYSDTNIGTSSTTAIDVSLAGVPDGDAYVYGILWTDQGSHTEGTWGARLQFWRTWGTGNDQIDTGYVAVEDEWLKVQIEHVGTDLVLTVWASDGTTVIAQQTWGIDAAAWIETAEHHVLDGTKTSTGIWVDDLEWVYETDEVEPPIPVSEKWSVGSTNVVIPMRGWKGVW